MTFAANKNTVSEYMRQIGKVMAGESRTCPNCGETLRSMKEVGRDVYGSCGCRLYQGRLPGWYAAIQAEER